MPPSARRRRHPLAAQRQRHVLQQHRDDAAPRLQPRSGRFSIATSVASAGSATCRRMAKLEDESARGSLGFPDADWINFETTVSTSAGPDRARARLSAARMDRERPALLPLQDGRPMLPFFCYLSARWEVKRGEWHGMPIEVYYDRQAPVQRRPDDRGDAEVARLLHDELLALPAQAGAHPRVPALRALRAELREHDSVLGVDRLHRRPARSGRHRLRVLRDRARSRAPVVGAPGDRRGRAGLDDDRRVAGAVLGADGDGEGVRPRADAPLPEVRARSLPERSRRRS